MRLCLAQEMQAAGHAVEFVVMSCGGELEQQVLESFPITNLQASRIRAVPVRFAKYLRKNRLDAVLAAMWPLTSAAIAGQAISGVRCKILVSDHNNLSIQYGGSKAGLLALRLSLMASYRWASARVAVSEGILLELSKMSRLPSSAYQHIPNPLMPLSQRGSGVTPDVLLRWRAQSGPRILSVGKLKAQKNHRLLIQAFAALDVGQSASLMIVGGGELEGELKTQAEMSGIADRVFFAGFQESLEIFYESADLFVLSSDYEGFGNVLLEALHAGLRVVSTDCPHGPSEILAGGKYGALVPVGDAEALTEAMATALSEGIDSDRQQSRAAEYLPSRIAQQYLSLLQ